MFRINVHCAQLNGGSKKADLYLIATTDEEQKTKLLRTATIKNSTEPSFKVKPVFVPANRVYLWLYSYHFWSRDELIGQTVVNVENNGEDVIKTWVVLQEGKESEKECGKVQISIEFPQNQELVEAVKEFNSAKVRILFNEKGASPPKGMNLLKMAIGSFNDPGLKNVEASDVDGVLSLLLTNCPTGHIKELELGSGNTLLHFLGCHGFVESLQSARESSELYIDELNGEERTPLLEVATNYSGDESHFKPVVSFLISRGAGINAKDSEGMSVLEICCKMERPWDAMRLIVFNDADCVGVNLADGTSAAFLMAGDEDDCLALLNRYLQDGGDPNVRGSNHKTLLHAFSIPPNISAIRTLVEAGAHVNAVDGDGNTPFLYFLAKWREKEKPDTATLLAVTEVFLRSGADPNMPLSDSFGGGSAWHPGYLFCCFSFLSLSLLNFLTSPPPSPLPSLYT